MISDIPPLLLYDATELTSQLSNGRLTALDLMRATLNHIEEVNPQINAIVSLKSREDLLREAREKDETSSMGWLHGLPIAIKDNANVAGIRTTLGGSPVIDFIPNVSDPYVQRLQDAGAIVIGKTNCPESCLGSHTTNNLFGATKNPLNTGKSAGGSSGGAAAAIASGMIAVADGSDMMGSLRNPAGWNGLWSHRPTAGYFDCDSYYSPLEYPISTPGPIGKSVRDITKLLETMVDNESLFFLADNNSYRSPACFNIAWLGDFACPVEPGILNSCRETLSEWERAGLCRVHDLCQSIFPMEDLWSSWTTIRSNVIATTEVKKHGLEKLLGKESRVKTELQWEIKKGLKLTERDVSAAVEVAASWQNCLELLWREYDAIALPTAQAWPFPVDLDYPRKINGKEMDTYHRWMAISIPASLAGLPVTTLPSKRGGPADCMPIGIQLSGPRGSDRKLLHFASLCEKNSHL